jgi:hypothetical protein
VIKAPQQSLKDWGSQNGGPKAENPPLKRASGICQKQRSSHLAEYAATTKAKQAGKAKGKQFVAQPKGIAQKTARFR